MGMQMQGYATELLTCSATDSPPSACLNPPFPRAWPQVLSDVLEALVGAVYVDCGGDLGTVWDVVRLLLHPLVTPTTVPVHPIRHIQVGAGCCLMQAGRGSAGQAGIVGSWGHG